MTKQLRDIPNKIVTTIEIITTDAILTTTQLETTITITATEQAERTLVDRRINLTNIANKKFHRGFANNKM